VRALHWIILIVLGSSGCATQPCDALVEQDVFTKMGCLDDYRRRDQELYAERDAEIERKHALMDMYAKVLSMQERSSRERYLSEAEASELESQVPALLQMLDRETARYSKSVCLQKRLDVLSSNLPIPREELDKLGDCLRVLAR